MSSSQGYKMSRFEQDVYAEAYRYKPKAADADVSMSERHVAQTRRSALMRKLGITWLDIEDIEPAKDNPYSITDQDVRVLADLIKSTGVVVPILVRENDGGYEIIDGERRWRACKLLTETGEGDFRMVLARVYGQGQLTEEEARLIMHSANIGQRRMSASERALGFSVIKEQVTNEMREHAEEWEKGTRAVDVIAQRYGMAPSSVSNEILLGEKLAPRGLEMLDRKVITKVCALAIARLEPEEQDAVLDAVEKGEYDSGAAEEEAKRIRKGQPHAEKRAERKASAKNSVDYQLNSATRAIKRALKTNQRPSYRQIGEFEDLLNQLKRMADSDLPRPDQS